MEEIRSEIDGTVLTVEVEEGQMVAEEDVLAVVQASQGPIAVTTEVPGVVRELYVEPGHVIAPGELLALIDES